uniref:TORC_M domain-containing protein n=1 Tax=Mesocestoides corti TaxID=53468 RepID=A0A5K3EK96_MESCO
MDENGDSRVPPPRVRIFECAHDGIQELFNRDSSRAMKPMDERNFPKSFWIPPTKEHSKRSELPVENNQESFCISHRKSNSSPSYIGTNPAYLSEPLDHNRQKSLDTTQNMVRNPKSSHMMCTTGFPSHGTRGFDPRIPPEEQKWGMTLEELNKIHINYARRRKLPTHSLEGHRQLPASPIPVLSSVESAGINSACGGGPSSRCPTLPGSPNNATSTPGQIMPGGNVQPASVPRMQHPGTFSIPHVAPNSRALQMNLLPPQGSRQMQPRQHQQQQHVAHAKSASQPTPMSVGGLLGHSESCMGGGGGGSGGDVSAASSTGYALGPSSSLTRLHHGTYGGPGFATGESLPTNSSGHLAQDMEELSLSRGTAETSLPHLQQMFCAAPLLPLLSQPAMPGTCEYGSAGATQPISSAQHSHQSSMDSGVGPSVAGGHSIPSANQTPEHTKVTCFDSSESPIVYTCLIGVPVVISMFVCGYVDMMVHTDPHSPLFSP